MQHFQPSLRDNQSLRPLFCLCLSGGLKQVLLYIIYCQIGFTVYHILSDIGREGEREASSNN